VAIWAIGVLLLLRMVLWHSFVLRTLESPGARVALALSFGLIWTALTLALLGAVVHVRALERAPTFLFAVSLLPVAVHGERTRRRARRERRLSSIESGKRPHA
jgi:Flp pilus assembly protein TadB